MNYDIFLEKVEDRSYAAHILAWPDQPPIKAATREEALAQARVTIMQNLAKGEVVRLEIKPEELDHPWLQFAGTWANDPGIQEFRDEIERYRRELDAELGIQYDAPYEAQYELEAKAA